MANRWSQRGRRVESNNDRDATGGNHLAPIGERVPALCAGSVGAPMAKEAGGRDVHCSLCGRCDFRVPEQDGRRALPCLTGGTAAAVWAGAASGENAADRVRPVRRTESERPWAGTTRDVCLSWADAHLWTKQGREIPGEASDCGQANASTVAGHQAAIAPANARSGSQHRQMAAFGDDRLLPVSRGSRKPANDGSLPASCRPHVAACTHSPRRKAQTQLAEIDSSLCAVVAGSH